MKAGTKRPRACNGFIVMRNDLPCVTIDLDLPRFPRVRKICIPSELPPNPRIFRHEAALRAIARTVRVSRELRASIHAGWLREKFPWLKSLFTEAEYGARWHYIPKKKKGAA
jgi:hypothetical protein